MKKLILTILIGLSSYISYGQQNLKGMIKSALDMQPLYGATIMIRESRQMLTTDKKGNFVIATSVPNLTLSVSYTGYQSQEIKVALPTIYPLIITLLPKPNQLSEVTVSTGYQTIPKERATGSFTQIDNKLFNQQVSPDILSRLPAIANSVTVDRGTNSSGKLMIRGLSTIMGPRDPLIILDNFSYDGDINNINPNEVDNITILKDAAASSIWGAKAGNGVIVITTKKGKYNMPLSIEFNSNVTIGDKPDLSYVKQMSSSDFIDVEELLYSKGYYNSQMNSSSHPALSPVVELLIQKAKGTISSANADAQINALRNLDVRDQFSKYIYQPSVNQQYALNICGGSDKLAWSTSGGYDKDMSNLNAGYDRLYMRFQNTFRPFKNMQVTSGLYYTQSQTSSGKQGYGSITTKSGLYFYPYMQIADANGNALPVIRDYEQNYIKTAGNGQLLDWQYYPLDDYKHNTTTTSISDILANAGVNYRIVKGLTADIKYQYERQQTGTRNLADQQSYFTRDLINRYTQISSSGAVTNNIPVGGVLDLGNTLLQSNNVRGQLNYDHTWGIHGFTAIAGAELRTAHTTSDQNRFYGYNNDILTYGNVSYNTLYPDFISGNNNLVPDNRDIEDQTTRYVSYYANAAYTLKSKYTFSVSGRRDASNLFGVNTNNLWNPFWSTGASWNLSDEAFYHVAFLPYLKLRATYGYSGNINPSMVAATTIQYSGQTNVFTNTPIANFSNYYNPDLKWETSRMINFGLDFKSKNDRITGSIEYYQKKGTDLFGAAILDYTGGIGSQVIKNVASMQGHGVDVELRSLNVNRSVKWFTTLNFSYYQDEVLNYYLNSLQGSNFISYTTSVPVSGLAGKPVYSVFAYKWAGLDPQTGAPRGYLNGTVSEDYRSMTTTGTQVTDLKYFGSAIPTKFGSLINTVAYKNISLSFSFVYKLGYYFRKTSINYSNLYTNWLGNSDYEKRWQKPGDETMTNVPALIYPTTTAREKYYAGSEPLVDKGDNVRLQYISFSYELNKSALPRLPFKSVQFYVNLNNLGIVWRANKDHIDPDYNYGLYPLVNPRTYALGLKANF